MMTLRSEILRSEEALRIVGVARALETELERIGTIAGGISAWTDPVWDPPAVAAFEALQDALDTFDGKPLRKRRDDQTETSP